MAQGQGLRGRVTTCPHKSEIGKNEEVTRSSNLNPWDQKPSFPEAGDWIGTIDNYWPKEKTEQPVCSCSVNLSLENPLKSPGLREAARS